MTRNYLADYDLIPVSALLKETALNTEQTLDTLMRCAKSTLFDTDPRREDNADELTGKEEPDHIYSLGYVFQGPMEFPKAQPQHFAFGYSYGLGVSAPSAWGTGYKHLITPISAMLLPHFTLARKLGATI